MGETKQGAECGHGVTRHEPGVNQNQKVSDGNHGGEGKEDK